MTDVRDKRRRHLDTLDDGKAEPKVDSQFSGSVQKFRWTVTSDGVHGPLRTIYHSSAYKSERSIRESFVFDYPGQVVEGISPSQISAPNREIACP